MTIQAWEPVLVGSYDTPDYAWGVYVAGGYAYVANGNSGLQVIDVSDLANPTLAGSVDTPCPAAGRVYAAGGAAHGAVHRRVPLVLGGTTPPLPRPPRPRAPAPRGPAASAP